MINDIIDHLTAQFGNGIDPRSGEIHPVASLLSAHARLLAHIDYDRWIWTQVLASSQATDTLKSLARAQIDLSDMILAKYKAAED